MPKLGISENIDAPSELLAEMQRLDTKYSLSSYQYGRNEPVVYEFTQDPAMLHQYYQLRESMYRKYFKVANYDGGENFHDRLSYILIARVDNLCIGGCRLTVREGDEEWSLPVESEEFNIRKLFCHLPLNRVRHAEISRFVTKGSDNDAIFHGLCKFMYDKVLSSEIGYLFVRSPYHLARKWRLVANSFGVKSTEIIREVHPIDRVLGPDITWYLTLSDLTSFCTNDGIVNDGIVNDVRRRIFETLH